MVYYNRLNELNGKHYDAIHRQLHFFAHDGCGQRRRQERFARRNDQPACPSRRARPRRLRNDSGCLPRVSCAKRSRQAHTGSAGYARYRGCHRTGESRKPDTAMDHRDAFSGSPRQGDTRRLRKAASRGGRRCDLGSPVLRYRGRPARCFLCRAAGNVSQYTGCRPCAACDQGSVCFAV